MTTTQLLALLPASYAVHTNDNTVYNTEWRDSDGNDYAIEILSDGTYEVRHTGNTIVFDSIDGVLEYIQE
jgi:hypothetical protein